MRWNINWISNKPLSTESRSLKRAVKVLDDVIRKAPRESGRTRWPTASR